MLEFSVKMFLRIFITDSRKKKDENRKMDKVIETLFEKLKENNECK